MLSLNNLIYIEVNMKKRSVCKTNTFIFILIVYSLTSAYFFYSCKREPAQSVSPEAIMKKISESGIISSELEVLPPEGEKKFGQEDFLSLYGEETFDASSLSESVRGRYETEDMIGEVGIFKLLGEDQIEKYRNVFTRYAADMQKYYSESGETEKTKISNNAEVRDYGPYIYYAVCDKKDKVFDIIESALSGKE